MLQRLFRPEELPRSTISLVSERKVPSGIAVIPLDCAETDRAARRQIEERQGRKIRRARADHHRQREPEQAQAHPLKSQRQQDIHHRHHAEDHRCPGTSPVQPQEIERVIHECCQKTEQEHDMCVIRAVGVQRHIRSDHNEETLEKDKEREGDQERHCNGKDQRQCRAGVRSLPVLPPDGHGRAGSAPDTDQTAEHSEKEREGADDVHRGQRVPAQHPPCQDIVRKAGDGRPQKCQDRGNKIFPEYFFDKIIVGFRHGRTSASGYRAAILLRYNQLLFFIAQYP